MTQPAAMTSLFSVLADIQQRPGMYVAVMDADHATQLDRLEALIHGYLIAIRGHGIEDDAAAAWREFPGYLAQRFGWSMSQGPIRAIRRACADDRQAWELFWKLLADFRVWLKHTPRLTP
jgi:hypothetical protein